MKKYLVAMAVALMVCMLGMTAAAEEAETVDVEAALEEQANISLECFAIMDEKYPDGANPQAQMEIMTEVYEDAGWTVTRMAPSARATDIDPEVLELAYSDIDEADPKLKEKILDAREVVIFHNSWFNDTDADGSLIYSVDPATKTLEFLPLFSELFPGWDLPQPSTTDEEQMESVEPSVKQRVSIESVAEGCAVASARTTIDIFNGRLYVTRPNGVANNFHRAPIANGVINTLQLGAAESFTSGLNVVNVGYQDFPSCTYRGFVTDYPVGRFLPYTITKESTKTVSSVGVRMSTYATPGYVRALVTRTVQP